MLSPTKQPAKAKEPAQPSSASTEQPSAPVLFPRFTVAVEGNIGSGKSTLLERLKDSGRAQIIEEPVGKWQDVTGKNDGSDDGNLMARMYEDPQRWAYMFQSYVLLTMMEAHETPQTNHVKVMERTVLSARYCFFENLRRSEPPMIDALEYECLKRWFDWLVQRDETKVDLIVYLRTSPEVCMERLKIRARHEEAGVPMSYLQALHTLHDEWLTATGVVRSHPAVPILVLDGNIDSVDSPRVYAEFERQIEAKCAEILASRQPQPVAAVDGPGSVELTVPCTPVPDKKLTFNAEAEPRTPEPSAPLSSSARKLDMAAAV